MWLLSADRAELRYFVNPEDVPGGYAILSHTWNQDGTEQTYQDIRALGERCKEDGTNPRDYVSLKIRGCCVLARHHGYDWAWVDSCCIDKMNPAELSEAINSMFQWYSRAEVCYVYLVDVPSNVGPLDAPDSAFRNSRWHTRGWTLQELIAPQSLIFFSQDWTCLGKREQPDVARLLNSIAGIPEALLRRSARFYQYSLAERMYWASRRHTTRVEDEAYCLLGIFNVRMPTIYGEGRNAFQRLQLEIMKNSDDTSLFAWGVRMRQTSFEAQGFQASPDQSIAKADRIGYLLARSPHAFVPCAFTPQLINPRQRYPPLQDGTDKSEQGVTGPFDRIELPRFVTTSYGIKCRLPFIETDGYYIAVLLCESMGDHLGLLLQRDNTGKDLTRPRYTTASTFKHLNGSKTSIPIRRIVSLGDDLYNLRFNGKSVKATWRTIYIVPSPPDWASPDTSFFRLDIMHKTNGAFRLPHWLVATLAAIDFPVHQYIVSDAGLPACRMIFSNPVRSEWINIDLGLCQRDVESASEPDAKSQHRPAPWARVYPRSVVDPNPQANPVTHDCLEHHINAWPMRTKIFRNGERKVRISFDPCRISPETTLVIHLELLGPIYEDILRNSNVKLPTREELQRIGREALDDEPHSLVGDVSMPPPSAFAPTASCFPLLPPDSASGPLAPPSAIAVPGVHPEFFQRLDLHVARSALQRLWEDDRPGRAPVGDYPVMPPYYFDGLNVSESLHDSGIMPGAFPGLEE